MIDPNLPQQNDNPSLIIDRNLEKRIDQMLEGVLELRQWLFDVFRQGLGNLQTQPDSSWEAIAANMSNAKLTAIARRIRKLKKLNTLPNWPTIFLQELADYYLFAEAFSRIRELPPHYQEELLNQGGRTPKEKDVIDNQQAIEDQWLVIGQKIGQDEDLRFQRTWFLGNSSSQPALLLEYAWRDTPFKYEWKVGAAFAGKMTFHPGLYPLRAAISEFQPSIDPFTGLSPQLTFVDFATLYATAIGKNPWISVFPGLFENVTPVAKNGEIWLIDTQKNAIPVATIGDSRWKIVAHSGGYPITVFGEWQEGFFSPLSVIDNGGIVAL